MKEQVLQQYRHKSTSRDHTYISDIESKAEKAKSVDLVIMVVSRLSANKKMYNKIGDQEKKNGRK